MRAAFLDELGGIDSVQLGERPDPTPGAGQVLVRVYAAGVGPWDVGFIGGGVPGLALPFVPGFEVAGVVEAVGDGVEIEPGERVYASLGFASGGFAEYALASVDRLVLAPEGLSFEEAASLVVAGGTAHEALTDHAHLRAGETALITAAAGGVGSLAVQIAAALGARPVGVASLRNHDYLRGLGAVGAVDYHAADWPQQVRAAVPGGVDVLLDASGASGTKTGEQALRAVRDGGRAVFLSPPFGGPDQVERGIIRESFAAQVTRPRLEALARLVDEGRLRPQVEAVLPLDDVREALRRVAAGHTRGKIVLQVRQERA
jgi:NADPH:quinone reductase